MLEAMRVMVLKRLNTMRKFFATWTNDICPSIKKRIDLMKNEARMHSSTRTCKCRMWQLSGLPCVHAISVIFKINRVPEDYVPNWFRKNLYYATYHNCLSPMGGFNFWPNQMSNLRRIQVKDIVKEVEDYLKTYSSVGMDISWTKGGSHVINVHEFDKEDFTSWKVRFLVFFDSLEPYLLKTLEDGPFIPLSNLSTSTNPLPKPQKNVETASRFTPDAVTTTPPDDVRIFLTASNAQLETTSQITRDTVTTISKTASQDLQMASDCLRKLAFVCIVVDMSRKTGLCRKDTIRAAALCLK
ncbi:multidrug resistance-associated protein 5, partial [Tanacetum coccineum]